MLPSEDFAKTMKIVRLCAAICGANVMDEDYKVNAITYLVVFCIIVYFIFSAYTVQLKISENWTVALEAFCMVGSVLQGISKLLSAIVFQKKTQKQFSFLTSLYKQYEAKGEKYTLVLNDGISRVRTVLRITAIMYALVVGIMISVPLVIWAYNGRRLFVMQFYLPGLDPDTVFGYFATIGMQSTCLFFGGFGNFAGDMFILVNFGHCTMLIDIFVLKTKELNEMAAELGPHKAMDKLKDVIEWHQTYSNYIELNDEVFYWINFTQITTTGLSIVLTLVIMFTGDWPGTYPYLGLSFLMLYLYCGLGTLVEITNTKFIDEIYAIHWYILTVQQQKAVQFMLMKSQSPKEITVGGVAPLSVNTGLQVSKTIYSVFMMLLNFFE